MRSREYVSFYLGDTDRLISTYVLVDADKGDYDNPPSADYYIDDEYYDEQDGVVTDLVERYASIYKFDLEDAAIEAIQDNFDCYVADKYDNF